MTRSWLRSYPQGESPVPLHRDHISCVGFVTTYGHPVGTCFVVTMQDTEIPTMFHGYAVTARHVLYDDNGLRLKGLGTRFRELDGDRVADDPALDWYDHSLTEIDLSVAPMHTTADFPIGSLSMDVQAFDQTNIDAVLGLPIYYVGLFAEADQMGIDGVPMVRSGTVGAIAQMVQPFSDRGRFEAHLIDCRSYGGFSGSPVFIQFSLPPGYEYRNITKPRAWQGYSVGHDINALPYWTWLWGLLIIHYADTQSRPNEASNMGIGIVIPVERIRDLLVNDQRLIDLRKDEREKERRKPRGVAQEARASLPENYTRADFMGDLSKVSKPVAKPNE